jgi:hypothetical protein
VTKVQPVQKVWLSTREALAYLGCSLDLLEQLRNRDEIRFARYGKRQIWYDLQSIDKFIESHVAVPK